MKAGRGQQPQKRRPSQDETKEMKMTYKKKKRGNEDRNEEE